MFLHKLFYKYSIYEYQLKVYLITYANIYVLYTFYKIWLERRDHSYKNNSKDKNNDILSGKKIQNHELMKEIRQIRIPFHKLQRCNKKDYDNHSGKHPLDLAIL